MNRRDFSRLGMLAALAKGPLGRHAAAQARDKAAVPRVSVMLWTLGRNVPADVVLDIPAAAGYRAVELIGDYKRWTPDQLAAFTAKLQKTGIVVDSMTSGGGPLALADPDKTAALVDSVKESIPFARSFGCSQFILTPNSSVPGQSAETQRNAIVESLKRVSDATAKDGIEVLLEPIDLLERKDSSVDSVVAGFEIIREVARPNVKVLYDFYHEQRGHGNLLQKLDGNVDLIGLVHVAEAPKRTEPGTGEIDYPAIYRRLAELKYDRYVAMEFMPTGDPVAILKAARLEVERIFSGV